MPISSNSDSNESTSLTSLLSELITQDENKALRYNPYEKQKEFHAAGKSHRQRLFMAGNRNGKTHSGGMETSYHLTGLYPDWWTGRRFDGPVKWIVSGRTAETTRDVPQLMLLGEAGAFGTGTIPKSNIGRIVAGKGITDAVDSLTVKHVTGGYSHCNFKQYSQEREAFEGYLAHGVWFDEEPPPGVYSEGYTRTHDRQGIVYITFTPLQGMSDVVTQFYPQPKTVQHHLTRMSIYDVGHFTKEQADEIVEGYPLHEREARANGEPTLGTGKVFPISEDVYLEDPIVVPPHWFQIGGIDFGYTHPTACIVLAEDRDNDILHVTSAYRQSLGTPIIHAAFMKKVGGPDLPWAWPRDGFQKDKQSGMQMTANYRDEQGVYMLPQHAQFANGSIGLEDGIAEMFDRFQTGRLMINRNLFPIMDEMRTYHRDENGAIVKEKEDLICAIRYAMMSRRYGVQRRSSRPKDLTREDVDPLNYSFN